MHGNTLVCWLGLLMGATCVAAGRDWWVYWGTYTGGESRGIYVSRFDSIRGRFTPPQPVAELPNPSFLATSRNGQRLYAVSELSNGQGTGGRVAAYSVDLRTGQLLSLGQRPSGGDGPCHLSLDRRNRALFVANYGSGSVAVLPLDAEGRPGNPKAVIQHEGRSVHPERQQGPHAHQALPSPQGSHLLVCDLGLDEVRIYRWRPWSRDLETHESPILRLPPGSGPRHLAFHPNRQWAYVLNELNSTLTVCRWFSRDGRLEPIQTLGTLPPGAAVSQNTTAEVAVHPDGRFVYASNRGDDSIAMFAVEPKTGRLQPVGHENTRGRTPRHFTFDPTGQWCVVLNQNSNLVAVFRRDARTGRLTFTGHTIVVPRPVCAVFVPVASP